MNRKLEFLTKVSLEKKFKSKWFYIANIILFLVIVAVINLDSLITLFGGDFEEVNNVIVVDNTNYVYDEFNSIFTNSLSYTQDKVEVSSSNEPLDSLKDNLEDNDILVVINNDSENFINAQVIAKNSIDTILFQLLASSLNQTKVNVALNYYEIDNAKLTLIEKSIDISKIYLEEESKDNELLLGTIFPIIILPFFMLTIYLVQMIGAEINEEKSTKAMEIIISNVSAKTHFISKLLAGNIFVLTQGALLIIYLLIGGGIRLILNNGNLLGNVTFVNEVTSSITSLTVIDNLPIVIILSLILMIVTLVAYSFLAGILASVTTNMEDFQQMQTPIVIISLIGYYLSVMAVMFEGSIFIRLASYIPFISSLLAPSLFVLGEIGVFDIIISILLTLILIFVLYKYGLRIYKVGILNYSSSGLWKKMFKAMKN